MAKRRTLIGRVSRLQPMVASTVGDQTSYGLFFDLTVSSCFSPYSYERGDHAYLEEDDDAATFIKACRGAGIEPRWRTRYANRESRVRHYDSLRTTAG